MTVPRFHNRPNRPTLTQDGQEIWISRACAVVAEVALFHASTQKWYILLGQRGVGTPDFQGFWCLPCGYLDWDETVFNAMLREVWEESGLDLQALHQDPHFVPLLSGDSIKFQSTESFPWYISDKPITEKQNVSLHFASVFSWTGEALPKLSSDYSEENEVADLRWWPLDETQSTTLAFNHNAIIEQFRLKLETMKIG